jgi:pimeloyl-ACP methyl ester carboxylesterase
LCRTNSFSGWEIQLNNQFFPLYYETHGNPNHPCIVLITGIGAQLLQWPTPWIEALVNQKFYVLTFDNRDSGLSKQYDHLGTPGLLTAMFAKLRCKFSKAWYTLEDMAEDVRMLLNHLSIDKAHVLGISMGGMIAQVFALQYPHLLLSLILMGTTSGDPHLPSAKAEIRRFFSISSYTKEEDLKSYVESRTRLFQLYNPYFFNEEKTRILLRKTYKRAYKPNGLKRQLMAVLCAPPRGERLTHLQVKSLIIHGRVDPVFLIDHATYLAQCIPQSQLEIIDKMGHLIPDELCEQLAQKIAQFASLKNK